MSVALTTPTAPTAAALTAAVRCDRSSAEAAIVRVRDYSLGDFFYCGHHWRKNAAAHQQHGDILVYDQDGKLRGVDYDPKYESL
jgi:hypothetical protein